MYLIFKFNALFFKTWFLIYLELIFFFFCKCYEAGIWFFSLLVVVKKTLSLYAFRRHLTSIKFMYIHNLISVLCFLSVTLHLPQYYTVLYSDFPWICGGRRGVMNCHVSRVENQVICIPETNALIMNNCKARENLKKLEISCFKGKRQILFLKKYLLGMQFDDGLWVKESYVTVVYIVFVVSRQCLLFTSLLPISIWRLTAVISRQ